MGFAMPKNKGKRSNKPKRGDNENRELENYAQKLESSDKEVSEISINSILPDELLEQILVYLPIASIIRARLVCKKWCDITSSTRFLWNASQTVSQKPWFFKFIASENQPNRYVYDPVFQKWQGRDFLDMIESSMFCDSSDGLVCYMKDYDAIHVCNPITREHKMLQAAPRLIEGGSTFLINISVNLRAHKYNVSLLRCGYCGELSVQIYDSETMKWATSHSEVLTGWTIGYEKSVICNRVLYFLIDSTGGGRLEHHLIAYDFSGNSSTHGTLLNSFIPLPCSDICDLINLKGKLIIVAAIGRQWDLNNGFIIWLLKGKDWQEISRVTHTCFYFRDQLFGYSCSGADDLIYIHADYDRRLVVFDMNSKQWKDCQKCPTKDVNNGFCLQPRLISP
ncbi:unnamed protein product [Rhodiola kirilowii]